MEWEGWGVGGVGCGMDWEGCGWMDGSVGSWEWEVGGGLGGLEGVCSWLGG